MKEDSQVLQRFKEKHILDELSKLPPMVIETIEIPESDYKAICANKEDSIIAHDTCRRIANNGIPLDENKGEWEHVGGGSFIDVYRCSKCKHEPPKKPLPDIKTWGWDFTDFCPNCGADMRGE